MNNQPPCDPDIFKDGVCLGMCDAGLYGGSRGFEELIVAARNESGLRIDWHFAAGRAIVKTLDDPAKAQESVNKQGVILF